MEPIADLMDEHVELLRLSNEIRVLLAAGDRVGVETKLAELGRRLAPHVRREERGVFAALKEQGDFAAEVRALEADHLAFDRALAELDIAAPDFDRQVRELLAELSLHIDRENLGIFPVTVVTLGAEGWETVFRAHNDAAVTVD
ncbi:hemerythrin domain-containing protein [Kribbella sp. HUAS MG21]|uniref:Hemerythrin domain-containing protein n=1 Tax=Kribbella sp. HUAS MG21 TaxID=3160966 RepID=A0AAU7TEB7_9ACTN